MIVELLAFVYDDRIQFHNVGQLYDDGDDGRLLQRVPEGVRTELNTGAQGRMRHPAGTELRFVPNEEVEVTLSVDPQEPAGTSLVRVFWGPIQGYTTVEIGPEPTTIAISTPEKIQQLDDGAIQALDYHPRVCRLLLPGEHRGGHVRYHGSRGDRRPPTDDELPETRYLAYGTSITEGESPAAEQLTYVNQTARRIGADPINLGSCGTAYCDQAMAEHIATRDDWDVATLSLSINMVGTFSVGTFRERAAAMIETIASANPDCQIAPITIFPNARDVCVDHEEAELCEQFREALRSVVDACEHENVTLIEGPDLLDNIGGLTTDLVHPGDDAMIRIGESLAGELEPLL